jgi:hypothetical protein
MTANDILHASRNLATHEIRFLVDDSYRSLAASANFKVVKPSGLPHSADGRSWLLGAVPRVSPN